MSDTSSGAQLSPIVPPRKKAFHLYPHTIIGALAIVSAWFNPLASHKRSPQAAQHHARSVASVLHADSRFQEILISVGQDGCLYASGDVASGEDAGVLRVLVASTKPPVRTIFKVFAPANGSYPPEAVHLPDLPPDDF